MEGSIAKLTEEIAALEAETKHLIIKAIEEATEQRKEENADYKELTVNDNECSLCGSELMFPRGDIWIRSPYGGAFKEVRCRVCAAAGRTCKYTCPKRGKRVAKKKGESPNEFLTFA